MDGKDYLVRTIMTTMDGAIEGEIKYQASLDWKLISMSSYTDHCGKSEFVHHVLTFEKEAVRFAGN